MKMRSLSAVMAIGLINSVTLAAGVTTLGSFAAATTGSVPYGSLSFAANGALYGTTSTGGTGGGGTIFQVTAAGVTPVVSFAGVAASGPYGGMTYDAAGNVFYGTTRGLNSTTTPVDGSVFSYTPGASSVTTLHTFLASGNEGSQLAGPVTLVNGTLYGSTQFGSSNAPGSLFTLSGSDKTTFTTLATLASNNGLYPSGKLTVDAAGNVFGTTGGNGSANKSGSAFQYTASTGTVAALSSFTRFTAGNSPRGGLVADAGGTLYGTTTVASQFGGNPVLFSLSGPTHSTFSVVATFNSAITGLPGTNYGTLLIDADGTFYGTSASGGANGFGTVWKYVPGTAGIETLYAFTNGLDGGTPAAGLTLGADGLLYGTTTTGGVNGNGTVFSTATPEPASLAVAALGAVGLMARRRRPANA